MEVYLDLVVILNFLVDFLLLLGTNRLSGFPLSAKRCALASGLGGIYSGACMLPGFRFLGNTLWRIVSLSLMAVIAFGWNRSAVKRGGVFVLLSMALGGIAVSFGKGEFLTLVLAAAGVWLLCRIAFGDTVGGREYVPITLTYGGNTASVTALRDSGNTLRDPITGESVTVLSPALGVRLGLPPQALRDPAGAMVPGLRLIPARTAEGSGLLAAVRCENVTVGGKQGGRLVAFAREEFGNGEYEALIGGCYG